MNEATNSQFAATNISKKYRFHKVIDKLSLELTGGDVALLLGANGSGKSTLLRIFAGLLRADKGELSYEGESSTQTPFRKLSYFTHELMLYKRLSVVENLKLFHKLADADSSLPEALSKWKLDTLKKRTIGELSQGQKCRVSLCRAFLNEPSILFLDEPSTALDEDSLSILRDEINRLAKAGSSFLIATHDIERLLPCANKVFVLHDGAVAKQSKDTHTESLEYYRQVNR